MSDNNSRIYVNNDELYEALKQFRLVRQENPKAQVPNYIADCFLKIAKNLAHKPCYSNYSYIEDMVGNAYENCLRYVTSFDPEKSRYAFAYYTLTCMRSFHRTLKKEKQQTRIKNRLINNLDYSEFLSTQEHDDDFDYRNMFVEFLKEHQIDSIEQIDPPKKVKADKKTYKGATLDV